MEGDLKAVFAALAANIGIAVAKFVSFVFTGSTSLLAETFHSIADTTDQGLLLLGRRRAKRSETREHPFGHGRERFFWAFVVSLLLFSLGAAASIWRGIQKLLFPEDLRHIEWAVAVLVMALAFEGFSLRVARGEADSRDGESWPAFIRRSKRPELTVILLEDAGAVTGVAIGLVAVLLTMVTGNSAFDGAGSIGIGLVLAAMAVVLMREMQSLLIGEAADPEDEAKIVAVIDGHPAVETVHYVRTLHLGPEDLLVETKVAFREDLDFRHVALAIDEIEQQVRELVGIARIVAIEPDVRRPSDPDAPPWAQSADALGRNSDESG